jgi:hypothetical protein
MRSTIEMAREANVVPYIVGPTNTEYLERIERLVELVRADERAQPAPVQEPVAQALSRDAVLANIAGWLRHLADDVTIPYFTNGAFKADCNEAADVLLTPPASEPDYAWPTIADYEKEVGFEVNDAFKAAWTMARTTNDLFKQMEENT